MRASPVDGIVENVLRRTVEVQNNRKLETDVVQEKCEASFQDVLNGYVPNSDDELDMEAKYILSVWLDNKVAHGKHLFTFH